MRLLCVKDNYCPYQGTLLTKGKWYTVDFIFRYEYLQAFAIADNGRVISFEVCYFDTSNSILQLLKRSTHEVFTVSKRLPHGMLQITDYWGHPYTIAEREISSFYIDKDGVICERSTLLAHNCEDCKQMKLTL